MKRIALLLCFCSLAQVAVAWERNFADNPSAEADRNRDGIPDGWTPQEAKSPAKVVWDDAVAHTGRRSLRISDSANPAGKEWFDYTGRWVTNASRPVAAGKTYTLSLWIKTQDVTGDASACIAWWAKDSWLDESYTKRLRGTADWQHVTLQAKAPAKATHGQVYLNLSRSKGTVWFDDVVMFQGDAPPSRFQPVDIAAACNTGFRDDVAGDGQGGWTDQGDNDARNLPTGDVAFRGIPFRILDPAKSGGKACIVLKGKGRESFPTSATIPVGRKCDTVYFLHGCAWGTKGVRVGRYELIYEDGSVVEIPLRCDREIPDWWRVADTKESAAGWEGANAQSPGVGLAILPVVNGKPNKAIQSVRVVSKGRAVLMLAAVTTADGPPVLTERPVQYEFTDTAGWYPFDFPLDDTNLDTIDLTRFLDPPAGKHGFLTVRPDGHFYFADGTRARFWGTNIGGRSPFLEKKDAATLAARLAKYGVNMLRIHAIDSRWAPLIDYAKGNSRSFRADRFDHMDFLFAELKRRGIYVYFDLLDYRRFLPGDDVRDAAQFEHGWRHSIKGATIFNDRLIELQKEFATAFLTHRNPYTKLRYVDDPAFAVLEITNENSVFYFSNTSLTLPSYADELRQRWNRWLLDRHGDRAKLAAAWSNGAGQCALLASEDPAKGSVVLPMRHLYQDPAQA
ncbi:hypothetical protein HQ576_03425, partial [bacterium]|nr:hypothetical protein [bacterium]